MPQNNAPAETDDLDAVRAKYRAEREKRLDPDRDKLLDLRAHRDLLEDPYTPVAPREPVYDEVDAFVVGGGWGGLLAAAHLRKAGLERIRIVEKAGDVGGVWYWNRYPGAMCDVESYVYLPMLEELDYIPTHRYSYAPEIYAHAQRMAKHFELYEDALFHTAVTQVRWDRDAETWIVSTDRGDEFRSRYAVLAHGSFSSPKLPAIPGIENFKQKMFHTSRWDYEYTGGDSSSPLDKLGDKVVGIVGTGATGVQIVPALAETAKKLYVFQRTPSTVGVRNNELTTPEFIASRTPGWQRHRRDNFTAVVNGQDVAEDLVNDAWTDFYHDFVKTFRIKDRSRDELDREQELVDFRHMETIRGRIDEFVEDPEIAEMLKPYYRYLCKRPCFHDEYLPAFNRSNVELVDISGAGITRITENAVVAGEQEYEVDCLVLATGFDQDAPYVERIGFDVIGIHGKLSEKWADGPETFQGMMSAGFPNFFFLPPNYTQGTATTNFVHSLEDNAEHIAYIVAELERRHEIADVSSDAERDYVDLVSSAPEGLALIGSKQFLRECTPGRWNNEGNPDDRNDKNVNYPGTSSDYNDMLIAWRSTGDLKGLVLTPMPVSQHTSKETAK